MDAYTLVRADHLDKLAKYVNEAIRNGYVPIGGPLRLPREERMAPDWFVQAMVRGEIVRGSR
jgi:hypothetical protein